MEHKVAFIQGRWGHAKNMIWIDGTEIFPQPSLALLNKSPDGFSWGYCGSGPAQTALAILLQVLGNKYLALALFQDFKFSIVAGWPMGKDFEIVVDITDFMDQHPDKVARAKEEEQWDIADE